MTTLRIGARFNGPPRSANGGYAAGALAACLATPGATTVQLRRPPPLEADLTVADEQDDDGWWSAGDDGPGGPVLRARAAEVEPRPVEPVPLEVARAAEASYAGLVSHPFPTCFGCGPERLDGLRIFPGRVDDDPTGAARVAATWTPGHGEEEVSVPWVWSALDCIGGWAGDLGERLLVLGAITVRVDHAPEPGVAHVVVGGARGTDGRRTLSAASLYGPGDTLIASAEHTWFAIDPGDFA